MNFQDRDQLIEEIDNNLQHIFNILFKVRLFNVYIFLQNKYKQNQIDDEFKRRYKTFYVLSARYGFTEDHCNLYFSLLINKEKNLETILQKLSEIPPNKFWLSYTSKLIHTIDNNQPIYDTNIHSVLKLNTVNSSDLIKKKQQYLEIYKDLQKEFNVLLTDSRISKILECSRNKLKDAQVDSGMISDTKLLDSILWGLYTVRKNKLKND